MAQYLIQKVAENLDCVITVLRDTLSKQREKLLL